MQSILTVTGVVICSGAVVFGLARLLRGLAGLLRDTFAPPPADLN